LQYAEFIAPRVVKYPEVEPAFLLVIPSDGTERFESFDFSFYVICFQVDVHSLFLYLAVAGFLKQDSDFRVGQANAAIDLTACFRCLFLDAVKRRCPECDTLVKIGNVNDELADSAAVCRQAFPFTM
jgi:hypothetical protein